MYYKLRTAEIKTILRDALKDHYGFAPNLKDIQIMASDDDGRFIRAEINGKQYRYIKGRITKVDIQE